MTCVRTLPIDKAIEAVAPSHGRPSALVILKTPDAFTESSFINNPSMPTLTIFCNDANRISPGDDHFNENHARKIVRFIVDKHLDGIDDFIIIDDSDGTRANGVVSAIREVFGTDGPDMDAAGSARNPLCYEKTLIELKLFYRNTYIFALRNAGLPLTRIGETVGLTRERVRQIVFEFEYKSKRLAAYIVKGASDSDQCAIQALDKAMPNFATYVTKKFPITNIA